MINSINLKKIFTVLISLIMCFGLLSATTLATSRKLITKKISDSATPWSGYVYNYSFNTSAVLTYNSSISQISDLSFSSVTYTTNIPAPTAVFTLRQKSKANYGSYARYVVTLTRLFNGTYTDKIDYTLTYRSSDSGVPYSLNENKDIAFLVDIEISEPYDIMELKK